MTQRFPSTLRADVALLAVTAVWGGTFVTVKDALGAADPFTFLALRFSVGALAAAALAGPSLRDARVLRHGAVLGLLLFAGYALQTLGLATITPSRSAFITGLTVVFVPFTSAAVAAWPPSTPWRLPRASLLSVPIAAVGLWRLTGVDLTAPLARGDLLTLGCAVAYACHVAATGRLARGLPPMATVAVQLFVVAALSSLTVPWVEHRLVLGPSLVGAVLLTGLVASALAISVQVWAQAHTSALRAAVIFSLEPAFALAFAVVLGLGWPQRDELVGGALVVAAVLVSELGGLLGPARASATP